MCTFQLKTIVEKEEEKERKGERESRESLVTIDVKSSEIRITTSYIFADDNFITLSTYKMNQLCFFRRTNTYERSHKTEACETALLEKEAIALAPISIEKIPVAE